MSSNLENRYMQRAIELAKEAMASGEIPVGAVIVKDGEIIGEGRNCCEEQNNATLHAEILAIDMASEKMANWRISGATMYVTLEPCPMCMGAIISARVDEVVFGAYNEKTGACVSCMNVEDFPFANKPIVVGGYLQSECKELMVKFFEEKRKRK